MTCVQTLKDSGQNDKKATEEGSKALLVYYKKKKIAELSWHTRVEYLEME